MILIPIPQLDTEAQSHAINERIWKTKPEKTNRRGLAGTPGNPGPPSGRHQNERTRITRPRSGERMETGLRILARMIARAHLSRQACGAALLPSESPLDMGNGD